MNEIAGLLVVRLPEQNFDREGRGAFSAVVPKIGKIFYGGTDRMAWFDLDEDYYKKTLRGNPQDVVDHAGGDGIRSEFRDEIRRPSLHRV